MPHSLDLVSYRTPPILLADRVGIFLLTLSFVQKGKQRDNKAAERDQQSEDTKDYHYDFVSRHTHHLLPYVIEKEAATPVMGTFLRFILSYKHMFCNEEIKHRLEAQTALIYSNYSNINLIFSALMVIYKMD